MDDILMDKSRRLGQLLAKSPLDVDLKVTILESLPNLAEKYLDALIISLENEQKGIEILVQEAEKFSKQQDADWEKLEADQIALVDKMVEEELKGLDEEDKINSLRTSLAGSTQ